MPLMTWDATGEKIFETGVDHGVLYLTDAFGQYTRGVIWNGLTAVTESPSGAESNPQYADNIKYLDLTSAEEFGATIEAFTYPDEFGECDGSTQLTPGLVFGQQNRKTFGFSYRTKIGNDIDGQDHGYKLHLIYGAKASPSEKAYTTINDSPEAITFSWEITTTPVALPAELNLKPLASVVIDSTKVDASDLAALEAILYDDTNARLPLPGEVLELLGGAVNNTISTIPTAPTYDAVDNEVTIAASTAEFNFRSTVNLVDTTSATTISAGQNIPAGVYEPASTSFTVNAVAVSPKVFPSSTTTTWTFSP